MRVTINVLHREALSLLTEKGYKIKGSYNNNNNLSIIFVESGNEKIMLSLRKKENCFIYLIETYTSKKIMLFTKNYLANLRLFIGKEV